MNRRAHWNDVYAARAEEALTWFEDNPDRSLAALSRALRPGDPVIDIGGGTSRLVDRLLENGLGPVTVVDLSDRALALAKARIGSDADKVTWIRADITDWIPDRTYIAWHDRAVFHFLTEGDERSAYIAALSAATAAGSTVVIMTFDLDGPPTCSNLPVVRYGPAELSAELNRPAPGRLEPVASDRFQHHTPKNNIQNFQMSVFRRTGV